MKIYGVDPVKNPAVLDTLSWDIQSLAEILNSLPDQFWENTRDSMKSNRPMPAATGIRLYDHSNTRSEGHSFALLEIDDGQYGAAEFCGKGAEPFAENPFFSNTLSDGGQFYVHEVTPVNLKKIYGRAAPEKLPSALGPIPRLGIGTRMSKAEWPGIWQALGECPFSANAIQDSLRELNLLENIRERKTSEKLYYPGIGYVPEGHSGSTFEGLWLCGVVEGLKAGIARPYGADADHVVVTRGPHGLERTKKVLSAARHYSFFTIDVSDILDYRAIDGNGIEPPSQEELSFYKEPIRIGSRSFLPSEKELQGLVGKYRPALDAMDVLVPYIEELRNGEPFDIELSVDEHPPEIHAFDCLTSEMELAFLLSEFKRRGKSITHIAPNLGVEKHFDYRYPDGLKGLEERTRSLHRIASENGVIIDCHSGDDLLKPTRLALQRATKGVIHFKVSPHLQNIFADVLYDIDFDMFKTWWDDTYEFTRENAKGGSEFAAECLERYESDPRAAPHPEHTLFRIYCYATVGKRDVDGDFVYRDRFYTLAPEFYAEYTKRVANYLCSIAADLAP